MSFDGMDALRPGAKAEQRVFNRLMATAVGALFTAVIALLVYSVVMAYRTEETRMQRCLSSGRAWAKTGSHTALLPMPAGKITILVPHTIDDYGCVEVKR